MRVPRKQGFECINHTQGQTEPRRKRAIGKWGQIGGRLWVKICVYCGWQASTILLLSMFDFFDLLPPLARQWVVWFRNLPISFPSTINTDCLDAKEVCPSLWLNDSMPVCPFDSSQDAINWCGSPCLFLSIYIFGMMCNNLLMGTCRRKHVQSVWKWKG